MTYRGHVQNGVIVLNDPITLPDGTEVRVSPLPKRRSGKAAKGTRSLGERLLKHAGKIKGLPADLAINHDHYLYGTPKKS